MDRRGSAFGFLRLGSGSYGQALCVLLCCLSLLMGAGVGCCAFGLLGPEGQDLARGLVRPGKLLA
ncbi:hypothetical protein [Terasakiella pusilla]|uniref:hypothetical protein n=1 Tax=Terasakiella pusilla TaxID=64973 RepID=UPI003AA9BD00